MNEYQKLKKNYKEIEESLNIISDQNKRLVESNKDLVCQLYFFKKEYEIRMRKLLFLFFFLIQNYSPNLIDIIYKSIENSPLFNNDEKGNKNLSTMHLKSFIDSISKKLLFNNDESETWLNSLFDIFSKFLKEQNISQDKNNWTDIMDSINMITKSNLSSDNNSHNQLQIKNDVNTEKSFNVESFQKDNIIHSELQSQRDDQDSVLGSIKSTKNKNPDLSLLGENISLSEA